MSAKVLVHSLTDENPDLHKQVGCMNGMLQLFNRRHLHSGRRISSHNHKRLPRGQSDNHGMEPDSTVQKTTETNLDEVVKEKRRVSVESSRTSFSSSCSSTFSSVDCNKTAKPEPTSLDHGNFIETPSQILPEKQPNSSTHLSQQSLDLREVDKDSINREGRGLSVKTTAKAERANHVLKHIDSPRPLQLSRPVKQKVSGLDGSFPLKDTHRFSYDGRESRDAWKSTIKLKETPRLSLDSKESSIRRSVSQSRSNYLLCNLERRNMKSGQTMNREQEPGSNKGTSGVVAKLMGLEAFPDSTAANNDQIRKIQCCPDEDLDAMSTTSRKADESKHNQISRSPRTPQRKPASSPRLRNIDSVLKPNSGVPIEQAPWRKTDGSGSSEKPAFIYREAQVHPKVQTPYPSVYGEIEKRLMELEFKRSGKDLRALKQILDAMQKTRQASDLEPQPGNHSTSYPNLNQNSMSTMDCSQQSIHLTNPTIKGISHLKKFESSGVFMKQAKVVQRTRNSYSSVIPIEGMPGLRKLRTSENANNKNNSVEKRSANHLTPQNSHFREPSCQPLCSMDKSSNVKTCKSIQIANAPQNTSRGDSRSIGRSSTTVSPRLQQKQHGMEKQSSPTIQRSDPNRSRKYLSKQQIESGSPSRKSKPKSLIKLSSETRKLSHQCDSVSVQSESNISSASQTDVEVTSIDQSNEIYSADQHEGERNNMEVRLSEDRSKAKTTTATLEQPSPVSVLDMTFYREGSPSPVKKTSNAFKDESHDFDEAEWNQEGLQDFLNSTGSKPDNDFGREQSEIIEYLVHELGQANSMQDDPATYTISSFFENTNPEHKYVTEILLASGLLFKDLVSSLTFIQLHPSGHLINPNLFLVLEQTKRRNQKMDHSKISKKTHRKLIFDTVNEILVRKLSSAGYSDPWICPSNLGVKSLTGQKLLKELCSEVDQLQANPNCIIHDEDDGFRNISSEDMMYQIPIWEECYCEIPGIVLDIERLIFKDLISEVVNCEVSGHPGRPATQFKQLFPD